MSEATTLHTEGQSESRAATSIEARRPVSAILAWLLPFALVTYLAFRGGGYDQAVRDEVAALLWLVLLVGAAAGILPTMKLTRASWIALALLAGFAAWTALSATWSDSVERSIDSFALVATYLGTFSVVLLTQGRGGFERILGGVAAAITVIATFAVVSRLHPQWFPTNPALDILPHIRSRLNYPLNSWNGLAALLAMGVPLLLNAATEGRSRVARITASAALPVVALGIFFTLSRGGAIAALAGTALYIGFRSHRAQALPVFILLAGASALAIAIAAQFRDLDRGLSTSLAHQEGGVMAAILVAICIAVGLLRTLLDRAGSSGRFDRLELPPRVTRRVLAAAAVLVVIGALIAGGPGKLSSAWENFKQAPGPGSSAARLQDTSGNGRYQYWESSIDAMQTAPLLGTGAGTFQYWWAQHGTIYGFTAYAHSLYFETLGETGIVGFALIVAFVAFVLLTAIRRATRATRRRGRGWLAGAAGTSAAFAIAMAFDWGWHVPVLPVAFLLVAGVALQAGGGADGGAPRGRPAGWIRGPGGSWPVRVAIVVVALPIIALTTASAIGATLIEGSQAEARAGNLTSALDDARNAATFMPWAASPLQQQALVLEEQKKYGGAATEAIHATQKEPTNWEPYYVWARVLEEKGDLQRARAVYARARSLNPHSSIFLAHPRQDLP